MRDHRERDDTNETEEKSKSARKREFDGYHTLARRWSSYPQNIFLS